MDDIATNVTLAHVTHQGGLVGLPRDLQPLSFLEQQHIRSAVQLEAPAGSA